MFDERSLNNKINRLHERCLRIIYNEKQSQRLNQDNSVTIHHKNIQSLAIELCETLDAAAPEIIKEVFKLREDSDYNLRQYTTPCLNAMHHGTESASFLASEI